MKNIILRPLCFGCGAFTLFAALMYDCSLTLKAVCALVALAAAVAALRIFRKSKATGKFVFTVALSVALSAAVSAAAFNIRLEKASSLDGLTSDGSCVIEEVTYANSYYGRYTATLTLSDGTSVKASLQISDGSCISGDVLSGQFTLHALDRSGSYDELSANLPRGVLLTAEGADMTYVGQSSSTSMRRILGGIGETLSRTLKGRAAGDLSLVRAVLLGDKSDLGGIVSRDFSRIGVSHTVAVSGMHLSVIAAILTSALEKTGLRKREKVSAVCLSVFLFMGITGFSSSVLRAGTMHIIRSFGTLAGKRSDPYTSLGAAAALIVLLSPYSVLDAGFLLSVIAAYACIVYSDFSRNHGKLLNGGGILCRGIKSVCDTFLLTLLITIMTLPVMWKYFGEISLISPLSNLIFIPLTTLLLYGGAVMLLLCPAPPLAYALSIPLGMLEEAGTAVAAGLSSLRGITLSLNHPGAPGLIAVLAVLTLALPVFYGKGRHMTGFFALLTVLCLTLNLSSAIGRQAGSDELVYSVSGKNDIFVLRCGSMYSVVDVTDGSLRHLRDGIYTARDMGSTEIECIVLTHLHKKSASSLASAVEYIMVREVVLPEPESDSELLICDSITKSMGELGVPVRFYSRKDGTEFTAAGISFDAFDYTLLSRSTHPVVGFGFRICGKRFVYAGGSSNEGNPGLTEAALTADTVILGGHSPVYKSDTPLPIGGDRIISYAATEAIISSPTGGETAVIEDGGRYAEAADK